MRIARKVKIIRKEKRISYRKTKKINRLNNNNNNNR